MAVPEEFMNELLRFNFVSKKRGRGVSSILLHKKERKQREPNREAQSYPMTQLLDGQQEQILQVPPMVQNVKLWY